MTHTNLSTYHTSNHPQLIKKCGIFVKFIQTNQHKPLHLVEKDSISVLNPNLEPLPKPPPLPAPPDLLISLKLLSILPEPIDCKDINPPFHLFPFQSAENVQESYKGWIKSMQEINRRKIIRTITYLAYVNLIGFHFITSLVSWIKVDESKDGTVRWRVTACATSLRDSSSHSTT